MVTIWTALSLSLAKGFSLLDKFFDWRSLWKRVHSEVNSVTRTALYRVSLKLSSKLDVKGEQRLRGRSTGGPIVPPKRKWRENSLAPARTHPPTHTHTVLIFPQIVSPRSRFAKWYFVHVGLFSTLAFLCIIRIRSKRTFLGLKRTT